MVRGSNLRAKSGFCILEGYNKRRKKGRSGRGEEEGEYVEEGKESHYLACIVSKKCMLSGLL